MQDPSNGGTGVPANYTGPLQPGLLMIQWPKISNLTKAEAPYYTLAAQDASGGGFGLLYASPSPHLPSTPQRGRHALVPD